MVVRTAGIMLLAKIRGAAKLTQCPKTLHPRTCYILSQTSAGVLFLQLDVQPQSIDEQVCQRQV